MRRTIASDGATARPLPVAEMERRRMAILMELRAGDTPRVIARRYGLDIHTVYNVRAYGLLPRSWTLWRTNATVYCDDRSGDLITWETTNPAAVRVGRRRVPEASPSGPRRRGK